MPLSFVESTRGKPLLVVNGYLFRKDYGNPNKTSWRCLTKGCKARIETQNDEHGEPPVHCHPPDTSKIKRREKVTRAREVTKKSPHELASSLVVATMMGNLGCEALRGQLPNFTLPRKPAESAGRKECHPSADNRSDDETPGTARALLATCHRSHQLRHASSFLKSKAYIDGRWVDASGGAKFPVFNPSTNEEITRVADCTSEDVDKAVKAASKAFETFSQTSAKERSVLLRKLYDLHNVHHKELAELMTLENGKPLKESMGEIVYGASFLEWFSEEARRVYGDIIPANTTDREILAIKQPIGVAAIITPWNFPNAMITRKIGAALAVGCTCVIKPAEDTPLSALAIADLAEKAGFPKGVINVLPSSRENTPQVGSGLATHPDVKALSFTGSTRIGKLLLIQCASSVKKVSLELGGNAPFIVFNSADVDKAVQGLMGAKFRNTGQTCVSANRIFVQSKIYEAFLGKMEAAMKAQLHVGDGFKESSTCGPLINARAVEKVSQHLEDIRSKGGRILLEGTIKDNFVDPILAADVTPQMLVCHEETFGPLVAVVRFDTEDEVLKIANSTDYGLAGYFFSQDISQIFRVAKKLQVGMIGVNEGLISTAQAPFGGVKQSGIGREGSKYGVDEYTEIKYICLGGLS